MMSNGKKATLAALGMWMAATAWAQGPAPAPTQASLDELIRISGAEQAYAAIPDNVRQAMTASAGLNPDMRQLNPRQQQLVRDAQGRMVDAVNAVLTPQRLRGIAVQAYGNTFTQAEIDGLLAFYRSPAGRAYARKLPQLNAGIQQAMLQQVMPELMPRVQTISQQLAKDLKAAR